MMRKVDEGINILPIVEFKKDVFCILEHSIMEENYT